MEFVRDELFSVFNYKLYLSCYQSELGLLEKTLSVSLLCSPPDNYDIISGSVK